MALQLNVIGWQRNPHNFMNCIIYSVQDITAKLPQPLQRAQSVRRLATVHYISL
jgi:hypothetical protein